MAADEPADTAGTDEQQPRDEASTPTADAAPAPERRLSLALHADPRWLTRTHHERVGLAIQGATAGLGMQHHRPRSRGSPHDRRAKGAEAAQQGIRNSAGGAEKEEGARGSATQRRRKRGPRRGGSAARTNRPASEAASPREHHDPEDAETQNRREPGSQKNATCATAPDTKHTSATDSASSNPSR